MSSNGTAAVDVMTSSNRPREWATVDHAYRDFSRYLLEGGELVRKKKTDNNFPAKLHQMLSDPDLSHIIAWMPHGRAFRVLNRDLFTTTSIPSYFRQTKFASFARQLPRWGYKRLYSAGPDMGCYYHEHFLQDMPTLTWLMKRLSSNQGNFTPDPEGEPNFYMISRLYPLPPQAIAYDPGNASNSKESKQEEAPLLMPHVQAYDWNNTASDWNNIDYTCEEDDDYTQECLEGEEEDGFCDAMNAFIDGFQV
jgi:hypothetical protein